MRILIVGDDRFSRGRIERVTRDILGRRIACLKTIPDLQGAHQYLSHTPIDLLLLDLDRQANDAFSLLRDSVAKTFSTVVFSEAAEQALAAFDHGAHGFVLKPIEPSAMARALNRLLEARRRSDYAHRYLSVRRKGGIKLIPIDDVLYAKGAGPYSEIVMRDGSTELHNKSLEALLDLLPGLFERIHRSYIVNMAAVTSFLAHEGSRYEAELSCGTRLPVGRTRFKKIRERLR